MARNKQPTAKPTPATGDKTGAGVNKKGIVSKTTKKGGTATPKKSSTKQAAIASPSENVGSAPKDLPFKKMKGDDFGTADENADGESAALIGKPWSGRPEVEEKIKPHKDGVQPENTDRLHPAIAMATAEQPVGSNFMFPYNASLRYNYLFGFPRTTLANYNNRRSWPSMEGKAKPGWVAGIVEKEQAMLRQQQKVAASTKVTQAIGNGTKGKGAK